MELQGRASAALACFFSIVIAFAVPRVADARPARTPHVLKPGARLDPGESLRSAGGHFKLAMQLDGNLVLSKDRRPIWSSQTERNRGARAAMQRDGNLVVTSATGTPLFASGTVGNSGARLVLQRDGNAVVYARNGQGLWDARKDTFVLRRNQFLRAGQGRRSPDGTYLLAMQPDGNLVLTRRSPRQALWSSQTHGNLGATAVMQADGQLVVYTSAHEPIYGTGTMGNPGALLAVQDDGNVVVYGAHARGLWSSALDGFRLSAGQILRAGQWRDSIDGRFRLQMQGDGNLVLVALPGNRPLWGTGTQGAGAWAGMQLNGDLAVYSGAGQGLWHTGTATPGTVLEVQTDGNLVLYAPDRTPLWSSNTHQG
jgi:hypothetical protein